MLLLVQLLCFLFAFLYTGSLVDKKASRFDKILGGFMTIAMVFFILYIEVILK